MPRQEEVKACYALDTTLNATIGDYLVKLGRFDYLSRDPAPAATAAAVDPRVDELIATVAALQQHLDDSDVLHEKRELSLAEAVKSRVKETNHLLLSGQMTTVKSRISALEKAAVTPAPAPAKPGASSSRSTTSSTKRPAPPTTPSRRRSTSKAAKGKGKERASTITDDDFAAMLD